MMFSSQSKQSFSPSLPISPFFISSKLLLFAYASHLVLQLQLVNSANPFSSPGWIVVGTVSDPSSPPPCHSLCVNVYQALELGHRLFPYLCLRGTQNSKEQWTYNTRDLSLSTLTTSRSTGEVLCITRSQLNQPVFLRSCDGSSPQRWSFINGSFIQNGDPNDSLFLHAPVIDTANQPDDLLATYSLYVDKGTGGPNITRFTFLPLSVLENVPSTLPTSSSNLIQNAGFDDLHLPFGNFTIDPQFAYTVCGWRIESPVMVVPVLSPGTNRGNYSMDLLSYGVVSQTVPTTAGAEYLLAFQLSGNRSCGFVELQVHVNGSSVPSQYFYQNVTEGTPEWQSHHLTLAASAQSVILSFVSVASNSSCGPILDNIELYYFKNNGLSASTRERGHLLAPLVIGWAIATIALFCLGSCLGYTYLKKPTRNNREHHQNERLARRYSLEEVKHLTLDFHNHIGRGGFGDVYRAHLSDETPIAVKRGFRTGRNDNFEDEVDMMFRVHHRYILNFLGYCDDQDEKILLIEYMPNGSLYHQLHVEKNPSLTWRFRMRIAFQVAYGLEYLHHGADPPILHRDVKSANILLADDWSAKVADFGLSKEGKWNADKVASTFTEIKGSRGYMDPQYFETSVLSEKSDVYSYGVMLLELTSGKKVVLETGELLVRWAMVHFEEEGDMEQVLDESLRESVEREELRGVMQIVKMCVRRDGKERPFMFEVVRLLREQLWCMNFLHETAQVTPVGSAVTSHGASSMSILSGR